MLPFKILTQTPFSAITLVEAKAQCRVRPSQIIDDDFINSLILGAADAAQEYLHWMVSEGTVTQYAEEGGALSLYGSYVTAITEVTATDSIGTLVTLTTGDYSYNIITEEIYVDPTKYCKIFITYACGASDEQLPRCVKSGMLMMISTMYNNREDFITGLTVAEMPLTSKNLLSLRRRYVS